MKVAIVNWPINDVGGINTYCENMIAGFRTLGGYEVDLIHATPQLKYNNAKHGERVNQTTKRRFTILEGYHFSYNDQHVTEAVDALNTYDLVIFLHPSPHPTKAVKEHPCHLNWQALYNELTVPDLVIFHDANWAKTNSWFADVADRVDAALGAQHIFFPSIEQYPANCPKTWEYFPLNLEQMLSDSAEEDKVEQGILATQWLKWKNHHKFLPVMPQIKYPIMVFGSGMEYHNLAKTPEFAEAFNIDYTTDKEYNPDSPHEYHGYVDYVYVMVEMARSTFSIDLSTKGYTNMTHWEPMACETLNLIHEDVLANEYCEIPDDCCMTFNFGNVADVINETMENPDWIDKRVTNASKFITKCDNVQVVSRIMSWLKKEGVV